MAEDEIVVACTSVILVSLGAASVMADAMADAKKRKRKHKMWVSEYIRKRDKYAAFNTLMPLLVRSISSICVWMLTFSRNWKYVTNKAIKSWQLVASLVVFYIPLVQQVGNLSN